VEGGQGVIDWVVVTFAVLGEEVGESLLREESMAGDWLQVCAPLGLGGEGR
jgi:hypothetical protein